jgi:leucyl-tRNA synthetase
MTLAPEHPLVQEITTPEYQDKINEYILASSKRSKENVWQMLKPFQDLLEHMLNILYQRAGSGLDWGLCFAGYGTGAVMAVVETKEMLC